MRGDHAQGACEPCSAQRGGDAHALEPRRCDLGPVGGVEICLGGPAAEGASAVRGSAVRAARSGARGAQVGVHMQRPMQQAGDAFRGRRLAARGGGIDSGGSIWGLVGAGRRPEVQAQRPVQPVRRPRRGPVGRVRSGQGGACAAAAAARSVVGARRGPRPRRERWRRAPARARGVPTHGPGQRLRTARRPDGARLG
jgi:hypothetical protein